MAEYLRNCLFVVDLNPVFRIKPPDKCVLKSPINLLKTHNPQLLQCGSVTILLILTFCWYSQYLFTHVERFSRCFESRPGDNTATINKTTIEKQFIDREKNYVAFLVSLSCFFAEDMELNVLIVAKYFLQ